MNPEYQALPPGRLANVPVPINNPVITAYQDSKDDDDEIDLRELWQVIVRRKGLILSIAALVFMIALVATLM
ncbi:MAG: hypothetical protein RLZZ422_2584, partial [Pseudomonadota bacterium]